MNANLRPAHRNGACLYPPKWDVGMTKTLTKILILSGVVALNAIAVDAGTQQVTVRVSPKHAYAPADIIVYVILERNADNRTLRVSAESSDFFRSSELQLDGESAARV